MQQAFPVLRALPEARLSAETQEQEPQVLPSDSEAK